MPDQNDPYFWAKRAFDASDDWYKDHNQIMVQSGTIVIRSSMILNGGACLALLAFLANTITATDGSEYSDLTGAILDSLVIFACGAFTAVLGGGFSYLVNMFRMYQFHSRTKHFDSPFIRDTPASKRFAWWGDFFQWISIATVIISLVSFLFALIRLAVQLTLWT